MEASTATLDPTAIPNRLLYSVPEARAKLGAISHSLFYKLVTNGTLHLTKVGNRSMVTADELVAVVARLSSRGVDEEPDGEDRGEPAPEQSAAA